MGGLSQLLLAKLWELSCGSSRRDSCFIFSKFSRSICRRTKMYDKICCNNYNFCKMCKNSLCCLSVYDGILSQNMAFAFKEIRHSRQTKRFGFVSRTNRVPRLFLLVRVLANFLVLKFARQPSRMPA